MDNPFQLSFVRAAVVSPELRVADVAFNVSVMIDAMQRASDKGCALVLFPELGVTSYTCGDLFYQSLLLNAARTALRQAARFVFAAEFSDGWKV